MISLTDQEFLELSGYFKANYGVNLEKKRTLIEGRLSHYVSTLGFKCFNDYFNFVKKDPTGKELSCMIDRLTTNHTFFMREEEHFVLFQNTILPWIDNTLKEKSLRIWSAGCSSGEEPYALSMIIFDYIKKHPGDWDTTVLATDISTKALQLGQNGEFHSEELNHLCDEWKKDYFTKIDDISYKVKSKLRENVIFRTFNLLDDFPRKKTFHTIFCRNVMIYFDNDTKTEIVNKFYNSICDGGYFIIGHSESLSSLENDFTYISPSVYPKE